MSKTTERERVLNREKTDPIDQTVEEDTALHPPFGWTRVLAPPVLKKNLKKTPNTIDA
jgi:hypothetical protein